MATSKDNNRYYLFAIFMLLIIFIISLVYIFNKTSKARNSTQHHVDEQQESSITPTDTIKLKDGATYILVIPQ